MQFLERSVKFFHLTHGESEVITKKVKRFCDSEPVSPRADRCSVLVAFLNCEGSKPREAGSGRPRRAPLSKDAAQRGRLDSKGAKVWQQGSRRAGRSCAILPTVRHSVRYRPRLRGITPRRLSAAKRALQKERNRYALFVNQLVQEEPEERINRFDAQVLVREQSYRNLAAKHRRWGREELRNVATEDRSRILDAWNGSSIPPEAHYFADFVRRHIRRMLEPG